MKQYQKLEKSIIRLKPSIFRFWDENDGGDLKTTMTFFGLRPDFKLVLTHWLIDWYGGSEKVKQLLKSFENKNFVGQEGTYNFNFYIKNSRLYDEFKDDYPEIYFDAIVDGNGEVNITTDDGEVYNRISQAILDDDIGWEVDEEIRDVMIAKIEKIIPEGIFFTIDSVDVKNKYPSNLR